MRTPQYHTESERQDAYLRILITGTMKEMKVTIGQLSALTGIERTGLGKRLSGKCSISVPELRAICRVLHISADDIAPAFISKERRTA